MERESVLHGINSLQSFETLPLKPNGQIKTWVRTTENHPIHQSPGMDCPVEFAGRGFRNTTVRPDQRGQASGRSHLDAGRNQGPPSLLKPSRAAPTPPAGRSRRTVPGGPDPPCEPMAATVVSHRALAADPRTGCPIPPTRNRQRNRQLGPHRSKPPAPIEIATRSIAETPTSDPAYSCRGNGTLHSRRPRARSAPLARGGRSQPPPSSREPGFARRPSGGGEIGTAAARVGWAGDG
jgi:hypothetical protein